MHGKLDELDTVRMGFLFSPHPIHGTFDGMQVTTTVETGSSIAVTSNVFEVADLWTKTRPFTTATFDASEDLTRDDGNANDWNITGEKSTVANDSSGNWTLKAHFNRPFETQDAHDYQFEDGKFLGYDIIGYYQIVKNG